MIDNLEIHLQNIPYLNKLIVVVSCIINFHKNLVQKYYINKIIKLLPFEVSYLNEKLEQIPL